MAKTNLLLTHVPEAASLRREAWIQDLLKTKNQANTTQ
jgi:hypothetical protein